MEKQVNKPKLRFPEFEGEWEIKKLAEVAEKRIVKNKDNKIKNVFTNSAVQGIVNQRDFFEKDIANQNNLLGYYIVEHNDFVYNPRISTYAPVGPISRNKLQSGIMSPLYSVFRFNIGNIDFVEHFFSTTKWHIHMENIANYGARDDRMSFSVGDFYKMPIPLPNLKEQTKIASFLNAVDDKLQALKKKQQLLEQYKKGLMQKIFLQELRFKDENGNEYPDWEEKKIREICDVIVGGTPSTTKEEYWNGNIGWIGSGELKNGLITKPTKYITELGLQKSSTYLMPKGTTVLAMTGATIGKIGYLDFDSAGNQSVAGFLNLKNIYSLFLFYQMQVNTNQILTLAGGAAQTGINKSNIESLRIQIPNLLEQTKIANFLSAIDDKINAVEIQIEKMEVWKKGLLQQMFC